MKKQIIFGAGRYGAEALHYYGIKNVAFFCDNNKAGTLFENVEVIGFESLADIWKDYQVVLAVANGKARGEMMAQLDEKGIPYEIFTSTEEKLLEDNAEGRYEFTDRSKSRSKLLMILAGYKEYLWDAVFPRIRQYTTDDMDVCVMTAGYANQRLQEMCAKENWSYLFTYDNKLSLTQNITVRVHPAAQWIYKIDEDIFVTDGLFDELLDTYHYVASEKKFSPGIVAPIMGVNSYGYRRVLEIEGKLSDYIGKFGEAVSGQGCIYSDGDVARYLWEITLPIDTFARKIKNNAEKYSICPHRFGIGCFLMSRNEWKEMGGLAVGPEGALGIDEEHLCKWCMIAQKQIIVAERAYAGHFGYGSQTEAMKKFYSNRKKEFRM